MGNADFYSINFEKEINLQGRSTIFLSIETNGEYLEDEALWVSPYIQPQTFETKFEAWTSAVDIATPMLVKLYFNEEGFAKNGPFFQASWDSIKTIDDDGIDEADEIKAVTMWRRPFDEFGPADAATGLLNNVRFTAKIQEKGYEFVTDDRSGLIQGFYYLQLTTQGQLVAEDQEFLIQIGKWKTDDNWYINQGNAANIAKGTIKNEAPVYYYQETPVVPNQFDGQISDNGWPADVNYQTRLIPDVINPWAVKKQSVESPPRLTWRIDYDGVSNSHLKINFLIVKELTNERPNNWPDTIDELRNSIPLYGQKLPEGPRLVDFQEVHLFGYTETDIRTNRQTYQNQYSTLEEIYDDRASFGVLKTNPKLTGNVKLTIDSNGSLWLNSIDASEELSDSKYKKFPVSSNTSYQRDLYYFLNEGKFPKSTLYTLYQKDTQYLNTKREYSEQYDNFYNYGVEQLSSKFYDEDFTFLAPLWMRKTLPDFFVIFRLDHPLNPLSYQDATNLDKFQEFFKDARIIKTFDMRETSPLGTYIRKTVNDPRFQERPLEVSFDNDVQTTWAGIDYASGSITSKGEFLYDFWNSDNRILDFEETITGGYERNGLISTNLINLEFLFNDDEATPYSINRYFGFYVTENQLAEFELEPSVLGAIPGQTPGPKVGTDGEPFNLQPFVQTNANGIQLPVHYYHNGSTGTDNLTSTPEYLGYTIGKFPLPPMVEDPLRIFYVKDRQGIFKRVNAIQEAEYGTPGTPSGKRVTQLQLFDTSENISDYGGITQITSQSKAELLDGGNAQLAIYIEDLFQSGSLIADGETLDIVYKKLNAEKRDYYYRLEVVNVAGPYYTINIKVPDYTGLTPTVPNIFYGTVVLNAAAITPIWVDSYLQFVYNSGTITLGNTWDVHIQDGNVVSQTSSSPAIINFFVEPMYTSFLWRMTATSTGLQPGESWDYPVLDPAQNLYKNNFCNLGTPAQVANALAECINSFENRIVDAYVKDTVVYLKSLKKWNDGNNISFARNMQPNKSVPANIGFYEKCNVDRGPRTYTVDLQSLVPLTGFAIKDYTPYYDDRYFFVSVTEITSGWSVQIRRNVDPANFMSTGNLFSYYVPTSLPILDVEEFTIDISGIYGYAACVLNFNTGRSTIEQSFVGGVRRKRARAKISATDGQRYFQDRQQTILGSTVLNSNSIAVSSTAGIYPGAPVSGPGVPDSTYVLQIFTLTNQIIISKECTAAGSVSLKIGDLSILNDSEIYQQWFQVQKENYSRMRGWNVQGKFVYSLPYLEEPSIAYYNAYSIIQVDKEQDEFFQTSDSRIIAYEVYRPSFGLLSMFPIKTFDVDTYFSEYSYAPTIELLRYYNRETSSGNTAISNANVNPLYLNMGENYEFIFTPANYDSNNLNIQPSINVQLEIEIYDTNDNTWKLADTIITDFSLDENSVVGHRSILLNTFYPLYFYDTMEVPNDYNVLTEPGFEGPYNAYNPIISPDQLDQQNNGPQYSAVGTRNYVRKTLYTDGNTEGRFTKARISKVSFWSSVNEAGGSVLPLRDFEYDIKVQSVDYYNDLNIKNFAGFASITDFLTNNDVQEIQKLTAEQSFDKFTYQMLLSEYDRLRENSQKDLAVKSKVVPTILKWVQEGTDARDNYYRLNNSTAFGITNLSPDSEVDFAEALLLTHEFPYLDNVPKDYPTESLEGSRSYFFQKLSDIAYNGKSWYELLTSDNTFDWFGKYFVVGSPTDLDTEGDVIPKNREERYTFFNYIQGLDLSQTLFRGAKINIIDYDTTVSPRVPINESEKFHHYRFAAIARFVTHHNFEEEKPLQVELINNEKYKSILMIITIYVQDYRLAAGLGDYSFFYYAIDQLRNSMQSQTVGGYGTWSKFFKSRPNGYDVITPDYKYPMEMPYTASGFINGNITDPIYGAFLDTTKYFTGVNLDGNYSLFADDISQALEISRKRQLFLGAGRLELDDTKLGGKTWLIGNPSLTTTNIKINFQPLISNDGTNAYPNISNTSAYFPISTEVLPIIDSYKLSIDTLLGGRNGIPVFTVPPTAVPVPPSTMAVDGTLSEINTNSIENDKSAYYTYSLYNTRFVPETVGVDYILMNSVERYQRYASSNTGLAARAIVNASPRFAPLLSTPSHPPYDVISTPLNLAPDTDGRVYQSFNLRGGTQFYQSRKNFISYANIFKMFNQESAYILYRKITEAGPVIQQIPDYNLQFVPFDKLKKTTKLYYKDDEDRPLEYQNTPFIGFDSVLTPEQEYEFRHRGLYEPKMTEIVSFWSREDESVTRHFEKDFLLRNTHINGSSTISGLMRNYFFSKVSDKEVLKIARTSAYKSLYPLIGEVAIDKRNLNAIDSSWDSKFYRKYISTTDYTEVPGTEEMQETKVFLASKAMIVPKSFTFETFNSTEVDYRIINPKKSIGVSSLPGAKTNESLALQSKPTLQIDVDLYARLQRALLEGMLESGSFDEFAWFSSLGIPAIEYTNSEIEALKIQYIQKNIIPLYNVTSIIFYSNSAEGLPIFQIDLTDSQKYAAGYRVDQNIKNTSTGDYTFILEKVLDTKAANAYTMSAVLKRI
jgi:hypothetical protein